MRNLVIRMLLASIVWAGCLQGVSAQDEVKQRVDDLVNRVAQLEARPHSQTIIHENEGTGLVVFLFGIFSALWAQNTDRNPWSWFFLGVIFNVITVLVLLAKNSEDRRKAREQMPVS